MNNPVYDFADTLDLFTVFSWSFLAHVNKWKSSPTPAWEERIAWDKVTILQTIPVMRNLAFCELHMCNYEKNSGARVARIWDLSNYDL